jgi:NodT family efflux transporter outer membrane factor (OMF) lipoprotein
VRNGFKVGPNPSVPQACTAAQWIDAADQRVQQDCTGLGQWWAVFQDPTLDRLIADASSQNLSLREAGFRVLEARSQLGLATGNMFPQTQEAFGGYQRGAFSQVANDSPGVGSQFFDQWAAGFNLSWELDFWGRFRRAVAAAENTLEASSANYDQVMVTLLGDVASNYVQMCTLQQRIEYLRANVELQQGVLGIAERRLKAGDTNALDAHQARSNLAQIQSQLPQLRLALRQTGNRLCVLLGSPPMEIENGLYPGMIPTAPEAVTVGIPADLLRRRPDVRRAERQAAAQGEQIGIAEADLYPMFAINGTLGYQSEQLTQLFTSAALTSNVGPVFQWKILNYGRIRNNMRVQDARFWALVSSYQETVLRANAEVEDGLAMFLRAQERAERLHDSVASTQQAVQMVTREYQGGAADFNRVALIQQNLVQQQDLLAQAQGEIAQGLIQVYRALGGGWEICPLPVGYTPIDPLPEQPAPAEAASGLPNPAGAVAAQES